MWKYLSIVCSCYEAYFAGNLDTQHFILTQQFKRKVWLKLLEFLVVRPKHLKFFKLCTYTTLTFVYGIVSCLLELKHLTNVTVEYVLYSDINHSDRMLQVTWLVLTNQSTWKERSGALKFVYDINSGVNDMHSLQWIRKRSNWSE